VSTRKDFSNFSRRLEGFAKSFEEKARASGKEAASSARQHPIQSLFADLRSLFTQGVTRENIRDFIKKDLRDTFAFYTRGIDYSPYENLPRYKRYPAMIWKTFVALANRMSPPRRIAFAAAIFLMIIAVIRLILFSTRYGPRGEDAGIPFVILSFGILFILLMMELRDKLDLKGDLEIAREIQFGLVPTGPFRQNGISIHSYMRPANTVGGDYYDILDLAEGQVGIVVGDVSGKGMPAALLMALMQGSLRTLIAAGLRGSELIGKLNAYLCANIPPNRLITLFYGELNTSTGELCYVNAGHNSPILLRSDKSIDRLPATALVLGIDKASAFEAKTIGLHPGERLLMFTDGISEAFNANEEEYGEARLTRFVVEQASLPSEDLIQKLVANVLAFCDPARPHDDITLMAVARE
jgi:sigma-B regulation protein RsbU (phosphoserine phosphatase)